MDDAFCHKMSGCLAHFAEFLRIILVEDQFPGSLSFIIFHARYIHNGKAIDGLILRPLFQARAGAGQRHIFRIAQLVLRMLFVSQRPGFFHDGNHILIVMDCHIREINAQIVRQRLVHHDTVHLHGILVGRNAIDLSVHFHRAPEVLWNEFLGLRRILLQQIIHGDEGILLHIIRIRKLTVAVDNIHILTAHQNGSHLARIL